MANLLSAVLFFTFAYSNVSPNIDKKSTTCPKDETLLAQEYLLLESVGRRAFNKAKDSCFSQAKIKYIFQTKNESNLTNNIVFVDSVRVKKVQYNDEYAQHDVFIEAVTSDGEKIEDKFRFMRLGAPGEEKPQTGCAILSIEPSKAYVLNKCKRTIAATK